MAEVTLPLRIGLVERGFHGGLGGGFPHRGVFFGLHAFRHPVLTLIVIAVALVVALVVARRRG